MLNEPLTHTLSSHGLAAMCTKHTTDGLWPWRRSACVRILDCLWGHTAPVPSVHTWSVLFLPSLCHSWLWGFVVGAL
jgi:hypothetical protein